jgi:HTH-type transcriptional repressor of NAD biosynthesis genes
MARAFVLMTALPPTIGHLRLIEFAERLAPTTVIVSTQPSEPFGFKRYNSILHTMRNNDSVEIEWFNKEIEQNPEAPGFWDMWRKIFAEYDFHKGDYIVASEPYGKRLAEELDGVFLPYDMNRSITPVKATRVRNTPIGRWNEMIPEFRKNFVQRVTIFGAESTGKTTLAQDLAENFDAPWLFEWARPYLETVGNEITYDKMDRIHQGQLALQQSASSLVDSPVIFQDTDLFSTVGYWGLWDKDRNINPLILDAVDNKSDLYLITQSNIPFEPDPLRYGGDEREGSDEYWINICKFFGLKYRVLTSSSRDGRVEQARNYVNDLFIDNIINPLRYERTFNG